MPCVATARKAYFLDLPHTRTNAVMRLKSACNGDTHHGRVERRRGA